MGGTRVLVHAQIFNDNLKGTLNRRGAADSELNTIRKGLVYELLNTQDTVLCHKVRISRRDREIEVKVTAEEVPWIRYSKG